MRLHAAGLLPLHGAKSRAGDLLQGRMARGARIWGRPAGTPIHQWPHVFNPAYSPFPFPILISRRFAVMGISGKVLIAF